jgi:O-antigen ligase
VLALPATLALIATGRGRRRWLYLVLTLGALVAVATSLGRLQVVGAVLAVATFALLSLSVGRRVTRPIAALLVVIAVALPLGAIFVSATGSGTFSRYASIGAGSSNDTKTSTIARIPKQLAAAPFGVGLGTTGSAGGFGGKFSNQVEGKNVSAETEYNFLADETGILGLGLWVAFSATVIGLVLTRLRRVADPELRLDLAAVFSAFIAFTIMGFTGPTTTAGAFGPFSWFAAGIAAYWLAGRAHRFRAAHAEPAP